MAHVQPSGGWEFNFYEHCRNRASQRDSLPKQRDHQKNNQCCYLPGKRRNGVPWAHFRGQRALQGAAEVWEFTDQSVIYQ